MQGLVILTLLGEISYQKEQDEEIYSNVYQHDIGTLAVMEEGEEILYLTGARIGILVVGRYLCPSGGRRRILQGAEKGFGQRFRILWGLVIDQLPAGGVGQGLTGGANHRALAEGGFNGGIAESFAQGRGDKQAGVLVQVPEFFFAEVLQVEDA